MAKTANLTVRLEPEIKEEAEKILSKLGISASNAIDSFYRQIILNRGLPYEIKLPYHRPIDASNLSKDEFKNLIDEALKESENGGG